ncbi:MAG: WD40 repeat domain-containing protein [Planctomycetaceae bacterium]|nr:WD40 repeat domain-containing protein [Planctomycetaceae bacterium]
MNSAGFQFGRKRPWLLLCLLPALLTSNAFANDPDQGRRRCAFVTTAPPTISALVETKLLETETVDWLERNEIDRILAERNLAASFDVTATQQRMAMGQLLRADLLVLMRSQDILVHADRDQSTKAVRIDLVVAETTMGLRLAARSMALSGDFESDAASLVAVIHRAIAKHGESVRDLYAVPPFMCHDPGYAKDHLMAVYAEWIERYLAAQPGVLVVEMAEAEAIAREYELASPADRVRRPLPVYVLGEFRHQGHGDSRRVAISVRLKRGQAVIAEISAEVPPAEVPAWLQGTAMQVLRQSEKTIPARMDMETEFRDVVRRSRDYLAFGDLREAHAMAELAVLLAPDRAEARELAIRTAIQLVRGLKMGEPGSPAEMLRLRRRALQHVFQASEAGTAGELPPEVFEIALASIQLIDSLRTVPRELIPDLLEYRREVRRTAFKLARRFAEADDWRRSEVCLFGALEHTPRDEAVDEKLAFYRGFRDRMDRQFKARLLHCQYASPPEEVRRFWNRTLALENLDPVVEGIIEKYQAAAAHWDLECVRVDPEIPAPHASAANGRLLASRLSFKPIRLIRDDTGEKLEEQHVLVQPIMLDDGTDVLWTQFGPVCHVTRPGHVEVLWDRRQVTSRRTGRQAYTQHHVESDGHYLWIVHTIDGDCTELHVVEPSSGRSWLISEQHGLPSIIHTTRPSDDGMPLMRVIPLGRKQVIVVASQGDTWLAHVRFDPGGDHKVNVFHTARNRRKPRGRGETGPDESWRDPHQRFTCWGRDGWAILGSAERQIVVLRDLNEPLTRHPLVVDPANLSVSVVERNWEPARRVGGYYLRPDGDTFELVHQDDPQQTPRRIVSPIHSGELVIDGDTFHVAGLQWTSGSLSTGQTQSFGDTPWEAGGNIRFPEPGEPPTREPRLQTIGMTNLHGLIVSCQVKISGCDSYDRFLSEVVFDGSGMPPEDAFLLPIAPPESETLLHPFGRPDSSDSSSQLFMGNVWRGFGPANVTDLHYSPDGQFVATTHETPKRSVRLWEAVSGNHVADLLDHPPGALRARFSPAGKYFAVVGDDLLIVWSTVSKQVVRRLPGSTTHLAEIAFSGDDSILAVWRYTRQRGGQGHIRIWNTSNWDEIRAMKVQDQLHWMMISPDNATILFGTPWATRYARIILPAEPTIDDRRIHWSTTPTGVCGFLPGGETLCAEPVSHALIAWDYRTRRYRALWDCLQGDPIALSPDGRRVAIDTHQRVSVRDIETRKELLSTWSHGPGGWMFSPDGKWLVTGRESVSRAAIPE